MKSAAETRDESQGRQASRPQGEEKDDVQQLERVPEASVDLSLRRSRSAHVLSPVELGVLPLEVELERGRKQDRDDGGGEVDREGGEVSGRVLVEVAGPDVRRAGGEGGGAEVRPSTTQSKGRGVARTHLQMALMRERTTARLTEGPLAVPEIHDLSDEKGQSQSQVDDRRRVQEFKKKTHRVTIEDE